MMMILVKKGCCNVLNLQELQQLMANIGETRGTSFQATSHTSQVSFSIMSNDGNYDLTLPRGGWVWDD